MMFVPCYGSGRHVGVTGAHIRQSYGTTGKAWMGQVTCPECERTFLKAHITTDTQGGWPLATVPRHKEVRR